MVPLKKKFYHSYGPLDIPITALALPNNASVPPHMILNSGSIHQPSAETDPAAQTPTAIAPGLPQANHEPRPQPSRPINIPDGGQCNVHCNEMDITVIFDDMKNRKKG